MQCLRKHPLFLVGFRPLFLLAMLSAIALPISWAFIFAGKMSFPDNVNPMAWHAHEMFYGFGWAVLGGFLLTASKNWVKIRGLHGSPLLILSLLWILERYLVLTPEALYQAPALRMFLLNAYMLGISGYVFMSLWANRKNDSYSDNFFFFLMFAFFIWAKNTLLDPTHYALGVSMTVGLFRLPFAVMFERTLTQFMKGTEGVQLYRNKLLDHSIKFSILLCVFEGFMKESFAGAVLLLAGTLLLIRWILWRPHIGFRKFGNAVMYIGYMGIVINLLMEGGMRFGFMFGSTTTPLHIFTFFTMGVVIAGMFVRICQGHTGRKPQFKLAAKIAISSIILGALFRLVMPVLKPDMYFSWIAASGYLWALGYLVLLVRFGPYLLRPRIDGKEH